MIFKTQKALDASLKKWQNRLRLNDWEIKARMVPIEKMRSSFPHAEIQWNITRRQAVIQIVKVEDYESFFGASQDQEADMVHELLHLHISPIAKKKFSMTIEHVLDSLMKAFMELSR